MQKAPTVAFSINFYLLLTNLQIEGFGRHFAKFYLLTSGELHIFFWDICQPKHLLRRVLCLKVDITWALYKAVNCEMNFTFLYYAHFSMNTTTDYKMRRFDKNYSDNPLISCAPVFFSHVSSNEYTTFILTAFLGGRLLLGRRGSSTARSAHVAISVIVVL